MKHANRETWLLSALVILRHFFESDAKAKIPKKVRLSCGWPSSGGKGRALGEAWSEVCSADGSIEIFISPRVDDPLFLLDILVHELVHAAVGNKCRHRGEFKRVALALGLQGPMTGTTAGPELTKMLRKMLKTLGKYPHAALTPGPTKPHNRNRHVKLSCANRACGFFCRASRGQVAVNGPPKHCAKNMVTVG